MRRVTNARYHSPQATLKRIVRDNMDQAIQTMKENGYKFSQSEKDILARRYGITVQNLARDQFAGLFRKEA